jgi:two-component system sensor histidine kinase BaeS
MAASLAFESAANVEGIRKFRNDAVENRLRRRQEGTRQQRVHNSSAFSRYAAGVDRNHFDTLFVKLFAAIAGAIALLTLAAYFVFSWSFERGFVQYLHRADEVRLERMVDRLAEIYVREGGWAALATDRERWIETARQALGLPKPAERAATDDGRSTERDLPLTIDPRLMLFDSAKIQLVGRPEAAARAVLKPVSVDGKAVGYLGYVPRPELVESVERLYIQRQHVAFTTIALAMLVSALVLGAGLAHWLARRIRALARGANALAQGDYHVRLKARGHDELAQLARDFNELAATLDHARKARQQWIADIAHELRTPLSILRGEIESLQDGVRPLTQASIASLATEAARLARLVEDLHTLSMSDLGALSYHKEPVPVAELVEDVIAAQRGAIAERGLEVETNFDHGALVLADETRLSQVFTNLLQNSLRYTDPPGKIAIAVERRGERVLVHWEDTAPGVPDDELPRLTDRLYRVESSRSRAGGGSGLGLAIASAIVEGHGGRLAAAASALGGLRIDISLPVYIGVNGHV